MSEFKSEPLRWDPVTHVGEAAKIGHWPHSCLMVMVILPLPVSLDATNGTVTLNLDWDWSDGAAPE